MSRTFVDASARTRVCVSSIRSTTKLGRDRVIQHLTAVVKNLVVLIVAWGIVLHPTISFADCGDQQNSGGQQSNGSDQNSPGDTKDGNGDAGDGGGLNDSDWGDDDWGEGDFAGPDDGSGGGGGSTNNEDSPKRDTARARRHVARLTPPPSGNTRVNHKNSASDPVAVVTGEKWELETDFAGAGPYGLSLIRKYRSNRTTGTMFGPHWPASLDWPKLIINPYECSEEDGCAPTGFTVVEPDGTAFFYGSTGAIGHYSVPGYVTGGTAIYSYGFSVVRRGKS